jgi:hypothetical protein
MHSAEAFPIVVASMIRIYDEQLLSMEGNPIAVLETFHG